jgi:hypothetical protein
MAVLTLEERIERAAREFYERHWRVANEVDPAVQFPGWDRLDAWEQGLWRDMARDDLKVMVPELFTDPPTHWLAPMEPTPEMSEAGADRLADMDGIYGEADKATGAYTAMRKAYTKDET